MSFRVCDRCKNTFYAGSNSNWVCRTCFDKQVEDSLKEFQPYPVSALLSSTYIDSLPRPPTPAPEPRYVGAIEPTIWSLLRSYLGHAVAPDKKTPK